MNTQRTSIGPEASRGVLRTLPAGCVMPLGCAGGKLEVLQGRVWLTRAGDPDDHFVDFGQSVVVPASGRVLVEAWDDEQPALVAWRPGTIVGRIAAALRSTLGRCWEIVDPARRIGAGVIAAVVALVAGALLFGPLSEARTRALLAPTVLHNSPGARTSIGLDAGTRTGPSNDVSAGSRGRARIAAQEARRRPAGPA